MAVGVMIRKSTFRLAVVAVVAVSAACGTTDPSTSEDPGASSADISPSVAPPVESSEPPAAVMCDGALLPALAALDPSTGEFRWTHCSADPAWREVRGATDDVVYVDETLPAPSGSPSGDGQLNAVVAIDAGNGDELWRVSVARQPFGWPLGPFAGSGVVVVAVDDDNGAAIVGLDASSGDNRWRVTLADLGAPAVPTGNPGSVVAPLANTPDVAVVAVPSGLVGLDRVTGAQLWSSDVSLLDESGVGVARGPAAVDGSTVMVPAASEVVTGVVTDGGVIVSGPDLPPGETVTMPMGPSRLIAVDASTGVTLWQGPRLDHPAAAEGHVVGYVHSGMGSSGPNSEVVVVDATTGEQLWSQPGRESYGDLWAIGDGALFVNGVGDDSLPTVVAYELDSGDERWRRSTGPGLSDPQQVVDDGVVLLWTDLVMLSTTDGTTRWALPGSVDAEAPMSGVGHNATSVFVSFNGLPYGD